MSFPFMSMAKLVPKPRNDRSTRRADSFRYALAYCGLTDDLKEVDKPVIVAPGCGTFSEAKWLKERLPSAQLIGIDSDQHMIRVAALAYEASEDVILVHGKMQDLKRILKGLGISQVHLGVFRHPNLTAAGPELLECINQLAQFQLKMDRTLVTTYYESEIRGMARLLQSDYACSEPFQNLDEDMEPTSNDTFGLAASKK